MLDKLPERTFDQRLCEALVEFVELLVRFSGEDVVRQQLLFQRTLPAFEPSAEARQVTPELLSVGPSG